MTHDVFVHARWSHIRNSYRIPATDPAMATKTEADGKNSPKRYDETTLFAHSRPLTTRTYPVLEINGVWEIMSSLLDVEMRLLAKGNRGWRRSHGSKHILVVKQLSHGGGKYWTCVARWRPGLDGASETGTYRTVYLWMSRGHKGGATLDVEKGRNGRDVWNSK